MTLRPVSLVAVTSTKVRLPPPALNSLSLLPGDWYATAMREETLPGGNMDGAVLIGGVVHKDASPWTPTVHALLRHLEQAGVDGVPRYWASMSRGARCSATCPAR